MTEQQQPAAKPKVPRTILVAITALDAGIVVVQPMGGASPTVVQGDRAAELHALALDERYPTADTSAIQTGTFDRMLSMAERLLISG